MTRKRLLKSSTLNSNSDEESYRVGPGRPPREFQFKPGQSGNPKGAKRKPPSGRAELKDLLERALQRKVTLRQGTTEKVVTLAAAGIEQLVSQFAKGDRYARRDLIVLAEKLGVDLAAGHGEAIQEALVGGLAASDQALLSDYLERHRPEHDFSPDASDTDKGRSELTDRKPAVERARKNREGDRS
jgi:hypothetical protein